MCARCAIRANHPLEVCWVCGAGLCTDCHDRFGACLDERCRNLQDELARARTTEEQAAALAKAGPAAAEYSKKLTR